jgi:hypothetical protein
MKYIKQLLTLTALLLFSNLLFGQQTIIASDERPQVDMDKYETYGWSTTVTDETEAVYSLNDIILKDKIKRTIEDELTGLGYTKSMKPDLILNFVVLEGDTEFTGFGNLTKDDYFYSYWNLFEPEEKLEGVKKYNLKEGSLLVHMLDMKTGTLIWQGYASGIMDDDVFDFDPNRIEETVELIFEHFDYRGDDLDNAGR